MNKKLKVSLVLNSIILILEIIGLIIALSNHGLIIFGFYTQQSNVVLMFASLFYLLSYFSKKKKPSHPVLLLKYISTCLVAVTFTVVLFCFVPIEIPEMGLAGAFYNMMLKDANFAAHFLCPVLAVISYLGFENEYKPSFKDTLYATIPTLLYAIVSTTLNVAKVIEGPYPFLYVYKQPVIVSVFWCVAILGGAWGFACFVRFLKNKCLD